MYNFNSSHLSSFTQVLTEGQQDNMKPNSSGEPLIILNTVTESTTHNQRHAPKI